MDMTKSNQINAGLQKSFRSGKSAKASTVCYGYRVTAVGELMVYPAEAMISPVPIALAPLMDY